MKTPDCFKNKRLLSNWPTSAVKILTDHLTKVRCSRKSNLVTTLALKSCWWNLCAEDPPSRRILPWLTTDRTSYTGILDTCPCQTFIIRPQRTIQTRPQEGPTPVIRWLTLTLWTKTSQIKNFSILTLCNSILARGMIKSLCHSRIHLETRIHLRAQLASPRSTKTLTYRRHWTAPRQIKVQSEAVKGLSVSFLQVKPGRFSSTYCRPASKALPPIITSRIKCQIRQDKLSSKSTALPRPASQDRKWILITMSSSSRSTNSLTTLERTPSLSTRASSSCSVLRPSWLRLAFPWASICSRKCRATVERLLIRPAVATGDNRPSWQI